MSVVTSRLVIIKRVFHPDLAMQSGWQALSGQPEDRGKKDVLPYCSKLD